jgi:hypothetical protein
MYRITQFITSVLQLHNTRNVHAAHHIRLYKSANFVLYGPPTHLTHTAYYMDMFAHPPNPRSTLRQPHRGLPRAQVFAAIFQLVVGLVLICRSLRVLAVVGTPACFAVPQLRHLLLWRWLVAVAVVEVGRVLSVISKEVRRVAPSVRAAPLRTVAPWKRATLDRVGRRRPGVLADASRTEVAQT